MQENTTGKNKNNKLRYGVVILVLIIVAGIFVFKNFPDTNKANNIAVETNDKGLPKLVDLGSKTCGPCQKQAPILEELKNEYNGKLLVEVIDVYEQEDLAMKYNEKHPFSAIPTQILYDANGNEVWSNTGFIEKAELKKVIKDKVGVE